MKTLIIIFGFLFTFNFTSFAQDSTKASSCHVEDSDTLKVENINNNSVKQQKPWNKVCPVMGNPVDENAPTYFYDGKLWGFCCAGCDEKFAKNPEKYIKNLNEAGTRFKGKR